MGSSERAGAWDPAVYLRFAGERARPFLDLVARVAFLQNAEGAGLAPFDCWLTLRGLKTMDLRMRAAADNAAALAMYEALGFGEAYRYWYRVHGRG